MAPCGVQWVWRQWVGLGDGRGDQGLVVIWSWWSGGLAYIAGSFVDVVGPQSVSPLLEPLRNRPVVFEGIVKTRPHPHFYQSVMDLLFSVVPLSPVPAQLSVLLLQVFLVEGRLP